MLRGPGGDNHKLVTANTENMLIFQAQALQQAGNKLDIVVTFTVTGMVIAGLQLIHINKGHGAGHAIFPQPLHIPIKGCTVAKTGEAVGEGAGFQASFLLQHAGSKALQLLAQTLLLFGQSAYIQPSFAGLLQHFLNIL